MQTVSSAFSDEIATQTKSRQTYGRIEFKQVDVDAVDDVTVTATSTESISDPQYSADDVYVNLINYATFETDRWILDGSFKLLPTAPSYDNIGWWSDALSGVGGTFSVSQVLTYQFTVNHSSIGFTVIFDEINNEYAVDFTLVLYNSSDVVLETFTVTGNTLSRYEIETSVTNYRKAILTITKWSLSDRRARVTELLFGIIQVYGGDELIRMKIVEEIDLISMLSPSNQLTFSIDNSDYSYDILNPDGIYSYLQKQMEITAYIGCLVGSVVEYVKCGIFYLVNWKTEDNRIEASFTANDKFELLQGKYRKGLYQTATLYDLAIDVLTDAGYTADDYYIDTALDSISVVGYIPIMTYRQALQYIALAGMAICYMDRNDVITVKQLTSVSTGYELDFNNAYKVPKIELDNLVKDVNVNVYNFVAEASSTTIFKGAIVLAGTQDVWVEYQDIANNVSASLDVGVLNSATYYTKAALLNITYTGTVTITVTGKKLNEYSYPVTTANETTGDTLNVDNKLVSNNSQASNIGNWIITEKNKRKKLQSEWRQNPAIECGDIIDVETQFNTYADTRVVKQIMEFNGALKGITEVKG